ncbi:cuticle protein 21-like [Chironomus tepperi]|uniref:cuticle protein 21-like n=1 Tax=Chironomus tepperi TaxID=113505 RepID=UPI00391F1864
MFKLFMLFGILIIVQKVSAQKSNLYLPPEENGYDYPQPPAGNKPNKPNAPGKPPASNEAHEPGMPFDFQYAVNEIDTTNQNVDFAHTSNSDGDVTKGEYKVALPDGRLQVVKYTADWKNGYNAEITYE